MVIVDTTIWVDYLTNRLNAETAWLDWHKNQRELALTDLSLCEVLQGVRNEVQARLVQEEMTRFEIFGTGGEALALAAAKNYRQLRARGYTVRKTIDCLIATFCIREGHFLLHRDRDFDVFEKYLGLRVVHPRIH